MGRTIVFILLVAVQLAAAASAGASDVKIDGRLCPFELGFATCNNASRLTCCLGKCHQKTRLCKVLSVLALLVILVEYVSHISRSFIKLCCVLLRLDS
jgi:hypothetical protein